MAKQAKETFFLRSLADEEDMKKAFEITEQWRGGRFGAARGLRKRKRDGDVAAVMCKSAKVSVDDLATRHVNSDRAIATLTSADDQPSVSAASAAAQGIMSVEDHQGDAEVQYQDRQALEAVANALGIWVARKRGK